MDQYLFRGFEVAEFIGFTKMSFELLASYKENDAGENYNKDVFDPCIRTPFQQIAAELYPFFQRLFPEHDLSDLRVLSSHASRANRLHHHFWGAFYRAKQEKKSNDMQLFFYIDPNQFKFGIYMGDKIDSHLKANVYQQIDSNQAKLQSILGAVKFEKSLKISADNTSGFLVSEISPLKVNSSNPAVQQHGVNFCFSYSPDEVIGSGKQFINRIKAGFSELAPLYDFLLAKDQTSSSSGKQDEKPEGREKTKYWLIAAGEGGQLWGEFQKQGIAAIGFDSLLKDLTHGLRAQSWS
jgi:hypothetical protein